LIARPKIDVGQNGTGKVTVTGAGTTVNLNGTNSGSKLEIGTFSGSDGTVEVLDGATINLTDDGPLNGDDNENVFLQFGEDQATGRLTMNDGTINATGYSRVGMLVGIPGNTPEGGTGVVNLDDSAINMTGLGSTQPSFILVGRGSTGQGEVGMRNSQLKLATPDSRAFFELGLEGGSGAVGMGGSEVSVSGEEVTAIIGDGNGGFGRILMLSSTATFAADSEVNFEIGRSAGSTGLVSVQNGSLVTVDGASGRVQIGSDTSTATTGSGELLINSSEFKSSVGVQIGSAFSAPNAQTGTVSLNSGLLSAPEVVVGTGGSIVGTGTVDAVKTILAGGNIAPGLSPGALTFTGDLDVINGSFLFEIGGNSPSLYDTINVGGILSASGVFDLTIDFIDGFLPSEADVFNIFNAGSIDSNFLSFANVISDEPFSFTTTSGGLGISFEPVAPVPLPAGLPLLLAGLGAFGLLKRRNGRLTYEVVA
jgi:hypothetical protein